MSKVIYVTSKFRYNVENQLKNNNTNLRITPMLSSRDEVLYNKNGLSFKTQSIQEDEIESKKKMNANEAWMQVNS